LLVFKTRRGNADQCFGFGVAFVSKLRPGTKHPYAEPDQSGSTGAIGEIRIATLEVKFLDRGKTNRSESLSQARFH